MKKILFIFTIFSITQVWAGDITGQITVYKKGGVDLLSTFENSLIYIKELKTEAPRETIVLTQENKEFKPRLIVAVKGQKLKVLNSDSISHNVFSKDLEFDLGYIKKDGSQTLTLDKVGEHKVYCNIHQNMVSDIYVVEGSYFDISDKNGNFKINNIPPGNYTLVIKHIYGGSKEITIEVGTSSQNINISIESSQFIREESNHLDKSGNSYSNKSYYGF